MKEVARSGYAQLMLTVERVRACWHAVVARPAIVVFLAAFGLDSAGMIVCLRAQSSPPGPEVGLLAKDDAEVSAFEILIRMARTLSECSTYLDRGIETARYYRDGKLVSQSRMAFETVFSRPRLMRFEYRDLEDNAAASNQTESGTVQMIVLSDEEGARCWTSDDKRIATGKELSDVVKGERGAIFLAAHSWPIWMISASKPEEKVASLGAFERRANVIINGIDCYTVVIPTDSGGTLTMWISRESSLIVRQLAQARRSEGGSYSELSIDYEARLNQEVTGEMLAFRVPEVR